MVEPEDRTRLPQDRLAEAFRYGPDAMAIARQGDGVILEVNDEFERFFGHTRASAVGRTTVELGLWVHPEDRDGLLASISSGKTVRSRVVPLRVRSGEQRWGMVSARPMVLHGEPCILVSVQDGTERHLVEEALRASEARLRTLADAAFEGIGVTENGVVVDCNLRLATMLGCAREELIGAQVSDFVAPPDQLTVADNMARQDTRPYRHRARRKDGTTFPVAVQGRPIPDQPGLRITAIQDLTDQVEAEAALRRSEADYRAVVEEATYGIYRSTPDGRFLLVNPALVTMLGYASQEDLLRVHLRRDVYADPLERDRHIQRFERADRFDQVESLWRRRDGSVVTVRLTGRPVRDGAGAIVCYEVFVENVSEREHLEAQLRQAQKMEAVGQLTTGIAHDFNNMLAVILANAQMLAATHPGAADAGLREIEDAATLGAAMIRQLLGFSRRADLRPDATSLPAVLRHLKPMLQRVMPKNITVLVDAPERVSRVLADTAAVEQMVFNLATNARDAMPEGGTLSIRAFDERIDSVPAQAPWMVPGEYVCLEARDTGVGMQAPVVERIFEPFFTTKPTGIGTGLGMSMVYGLMKQHRGLVDVKSTPGTGTVFRLYFPIVEAEPRTAQADAPDDEVRGGSETVLLVDDEDALRRTGERVLEHYGYTVLTARDGQEALDLLDRYPTTVDLVVSDLAMPRLDGWELYRAIKHRGLPMGFVLASGFRDADTQERMAGSTEVAFLQKPWGITDLARCVRHVLDAPRTGRPPGAPLDVGSPP